MFTPRGTVSPPFQRLGLELLTRYLLVRLIILWTRERARTSHALLLFTRCA